MNTTENKDFTAFLRDKDQRQFVGQAKDYGYYLFKVAYDGDCDFIQIMRVYTYYNPEAKPGLSDKSELGGIYIYSLGLLFNIEYDLRDYLANVKLIDGYNAALDVKEYYKQLCKDISVEIVRRVDAGLFDREEAARLIPPDDNQMQYYKEYREREYAERDFLDGKLLEKPDICITYDTRCEYDIAAVLEYLRCPSGIISARADSFMDENKAMIYKAIIRAETHFNTLKEIQANVSELHYRREIRRIIQAACVKTVNVTFERGGESIMVKMEADRLGWNDSVSDWNIVAADRYSYQRLFGYKHGGDARLTEITLITHGKKELYNKAGFDTVLSTLFQEDK